MGNRKEETYYYYGNGLTAQDNGTDYLTYHFNNVGSTMAVTDEKGNIAGTYEYSPYGQILHKEGTANITFLYNGQYGVATDENGLYYMRARYYNVDIKRFINQDVLTGTLERISSLNRYAYVEGNPINYLDPFGLEIWFFEEAHKIGVYISYFVMVASMIFPELAVPLATGALLYSLTTYIDEIVYCHFSKESIIHAGEDLWKDVILYSTNVIPCSKFTEILAEITGAIKSIFDMDDVINKKDDAKR